MKSSIDWKLPLILYVATWLTTSGVNLDFLYKISFACLILPFEAAGAQALFVHCKALFLEGLLYSVPLMIILTCHELGHYVQTKRYGVACSLPFFIPMPFGPFGTLGAVIAMDGRIPNRKALFDIGISGPIAGLVPTRFCLYFGYQWSSIGPAHAPDGMIFGEPALLKMLSHWLYGPIPSDLMLHFHPVARAGWVGLLLTSLNLMPIGQLDGGHVFYALLGKKTDYFSWIVFYAAILSVAYFELWHWTLILILLAWMRITHPPTANDRIGLNPFRQFLGWGILAFLLIGFTPTPLKIDEPKTKPNSSRWYCIDPSPFPESVSWPLSDSKATTRISPS